MPTLAGVEGKEDEVGRNERPFLIADIGRIRLAAHPAMTLPARHGSEQPLGTKRSEDHFKVHFFDISLQGLEIEHGKYIPESPRVS